MNDVTRITSQASPLRTSPPRSDANSQRSGVDSPHPPDGFTKSSPADVALQGARSKAKADVANTQLAPHVKAFGALEAAGLLAMFGVGLEQAISHVVAHTTMGPVAACIGAGGMIASMVGNAVIRPHLAPVLAHLGARSSEKLYSGDFVEKTDNLSFPSNSKTVSATTTSLSRKYVNEVVHSEVTRRSGSKLISEYSDLSGIPSKVTLVRPDGTSRELAPGTKVRIDAEGVHLERPAK